MRSTSTKVLCAAAALFVLPWQAQAQQEETRVAALAGAGDSATATATITAIDHSTREVSLKKEDGETVKLTAGPEVRRLEEMKVGDKVTATYRVGAVLALTKGGSASAPEETLAAARNAESDRPGGVVAKMVTMTGKITKIDKADRTVAIQGAGGNTITLPVEDDVDLGEVAVGDTVTLAYHESVAINVAPAGQ